MALITLNIPDDWLPEITSRATKAGRQHYIRSLILADIGEDGLSPNPAAGDGGKVERKRKKRKTKIDKPISKK